MKKVLGLVAAFMIILSSAAYAGGDKNCSSKGQGDVGTGAPGSAQQSRAAD